MQTLDFFVFAGLAVLGHYLHSDNRPDRSALAVLVTPFLVIAAASTPNKYSTAPSQKSSDRLRPNVVTP